MSGKKISQFAVAMTATIAITGYILLAFSQIPTAVPSTMKYTELSRFYATQTTLFIQRTGEYYVNTTRGETILNESSKIKVYNDREQLVFSLPLINFPSQFAVDSTGYYVIVLENVSLNDSAGFSVLEAEQQYVSFTPNAELARPSGLMLTFGLAGFGAALALTASKLSHKKEDYLKALKWNFTGITCFVFGFLSAVFVPLFAFVTVFAASGGNVPELSILAYIATLLIVLVYWVKLRKVADVFAFLYGYDGILLLKGITVIVILALYPGMIAFSITSVILPLQLALIFAPIFAWVLMPIFFTILMLFPFVDPLDYSAEASFSLNEFLLDYRQNPDTADFGLVRHASESIAELLRSYNYQISPTELAEQVSIELLSPLCSSLEVSGAKEDHIVQKLLGALDQVHVGKLMSVIQRIGRVEGAQRKRRIESVQSCLGYIATIVGSIASIVYFLLVVLGR